MTHTERLELLALSKAGHSALAIAAACSQDEASAILSGSIRALVSALVAIDFEKARVLMRQLEVDHLMPDDCKKPTRPYCAVSNYAEVQFR